jgi:Anti-sigma factor NepR
MQIFRRPWSPAGVGKGETKVQGDKPERDKSKMEKSEPSPAGHEQAARAGQKLSLPMDRQIQAQIGRRLSAVYDEILHQPVPDRFRLLLDELDQTVKKPNDKLAKNGDER